MYKTKEYKCGEMIGACVYVGNPDAIGSHRKATFRCLICGTEFRSRIDAVKRGDTKSCGCLYATVWERNIKHGHARRGHATREYVAWREMKSRCYDKNGQEYRNYGGRGIVVSERWLESFDNFYADMGDKPTRNHSLDRIDVNGNYELINCRWATPKEQANNRRNTIYITYNNENKSLSEWCDVLGLKYSKVFMRMMHNGYVFKKEFFSEHLLDNKRAQAIRLYKEGILSRKEIAVKLELNHSTISRIIKRNSDGVLYER